MSSKEELRKMKQKSYQIGVMASMKFIVDMLDQPTIAEDIKRYVLPGRNWRKRFWKDYNRTN